MALSRPGRLLPVFFLPSNHRGLRRGKTHENSEPPDDTLLQTDSYPFLGRLCRVPDRLLLPLPGYIEGVAVWLLYLLYMVIAVARQANRLIIRTLLVLMTANVALAAVLLIYLALRPAANPCPLVLGPLGLLTLAADFTFHICLYKFFSFHEALRNGKREI
jgi:hypothetical protein